MLVYGRVWVIWVGFISWSLYYLCFVCLLSMVASIVDIYYAVSMHCVDQMPTLWVISIHLSYLTNLCWFTIHNCWLRWLYSSHCMWGIILNTRWPMVLYSLPFYHSFCWVISMCLFFHITYIFWRRNHINSAVTRLSLHLICRFLCNISWIFIWVYNSRRINNFYIAWPKFNSTN